jgi:sialic acid synthase SpsE
LLGACLIEKHVSLDRFSDGSDDSFSFESEKLAKLYAHSKMARSVVGRVNYKGAEVEKGNLKFRRSSDLVKPARQGYLITKNIVQSVGPRFGFALVNLNSVLEKLLLCKVEYGGGGKLDPRRFS